ncbi:MAG: SMP-30/gluconolactonase/LRE family protein [Chitinophagaceae bacterium]|nr:SMP-30/gluconolactonase/LRE family protein [Chitinophagaceae bacterium]
MSSSFPMADVSYIFNNKKMISKILAAGIFVLASLMVNAQKKQTIGKITSLDPMFYTLIDSNATIEVLADGFQWSEGPVWIKKGNYLLFSDVKRNTIFKWKEGEGEGATPYFQPSGYTGSGKYSDEPGSNGLILNSNEELVACEHGDRRVSAMSLKTKAKRTLVDGYKGKKFNSPNDIVQKINGDYYFTDPPYGLPTQKTTGVLGVYRLSKKGVVTLLIDDITPNGLAFSPDEKVLYVNQSLPDKAYIYAYDVKEDGTIGNRKLFYDASPLVEQGLPGLPDGLKIDKNGIIFSTGPGGVLVLTPQGKLLGRIDTFQPTANCAWGNDGSVLYITANNFLCRIQTKTKGVGF